MKEGESTGTGSCGARTVAAPVAADRYTSKRSSRLAPEGAATSGLWRRWRRRVGRRRTGAHQRGRVDWYRKGAATSGRWWRRDQRRM